MTGEGRPAGGPGSDAAPLSGRRLGAAALLLGASVLLSRVLGFVREMVLAAQVGVGAHTDAYYAAFQIPDLLNYLLAGGALAIAFTPLYLKTLRQDGAEPAARLFETVLGTLGAVTVVLTAALWLGAGELVALQFGRFDAESQALTTRLTRIVLPGQIAFVTGGIVRAVLMAHGRFGAQAAAPLLYNTCIIAGGLATGDVEGFAWGALVGAVLGGIAYPLWDLRGVGRLGLRVSPFDRGFRVYVWGALPLMLGLSLTTVDEWYERWFGARLGEGVVAALGFARRLMMAPVAVIGQAVATAALPTLAALHADRRGDELDATLQRTLRATLLMALLCAGAVYVFAEPIVEVMYQRGRFGAEDSARVAVLLGWLSLAVPGWVLQQVAVRAFFARGEMWRPMLLGTVVALGVIPLYLMLGDWRGAEGLALAGAVAISGNAALTLGWARLRYGGPALLPLATTGLRTAVAVALAAGGGAMVGRVAAAQGGAWLQLFVGGGIYLMLALPAAHALGDAAMRATLDGLLARVSRRLPGGGRAGRGGAGPDIE